MKKKEKELAAAIAPDSVLVITMLTTNPERRDQLDQLLEKAFAFDSRVQVVRVVGYSTAEETSALLGQIDGASSATA
jgi:hypothetical protein